ncbi:hypothetical protein B0H19DRAFT_1273836 [Mycena capillaripes]|nr:hypothetical protein B0H19DRAFT_1273836 [Mycena capillaripes]
MASPPTQVSRPRLLATVLHWSSFTAGLHPHRQGRPLRHQGPPRPHPSAPPPSSSMTPQDSVARPAASDPVQTHPTSMYPRAARASSTGFGHGESRKRKELGSALVLTLRRSYITLLHRSNPIGGMQEGSGSNDARRTGKGCS